MMSRFRLLLWKLNLLNDTYCPVCRSKVIKRGYAGVNRRYDCLSCSFEGSDYDLFQL